MIRMLAVLLLFFGVVAFVAWHEKDALLSLCSGENEAHTTMVNVDDIEPTVLAEKMASSDDFILLDVRSLPEHEDDYIKGSVLIPLNQLDERFDELPKDKEIVLYCRSGRRSSLAGELLLQKGFDNIKNLKGGIIAWRAQQPEQQFIPVKDAKAALGTVSDVE